MIDGEQLHLVEINGFFQWLHEAEAEFAVFLAERVAVEFDVFRRPSDVAFPGRYPMPDNSGTEHVADEFVVRAVPDKERWTGGAAAVDLQKVLHFVGGNFDFVLQNAGGPRQAHHVGFFRLARPIVR